QVPSTYLPLASGLSVYQSVSLVAWISTRPSVRRKGRRTCVGGWWVSGARVWAPACEAAPSAHRTARDSALFFDREIIETLLGLADASPRGAPGRVCLNGAVMLTARPRGRLRAYPFRFLRACAKLSSAGSMRCRRCAARIVRVPTSTHRESSCTRHA